MSLPPPQWAAPHPRPGTGWWVGPSAAVVVAGVLVVAGLAQPGRPFLLDDRVQLGQQPGANAGLALIDLLRLPHWQDIEGDGLWRPLAKVLWALLGGGEAARWPLAILTVVLAAATAWAGAEMLWRCLRSHGPSPAPWVIMAAAWPLLHPATLDVLVPYVGQSDMLAALGVVGAAVCALRGGTTTSACLAGACLLLGLLAKESAAPAVAALPVLALAGPGARRQRIRAALFAFSAAVVALAIWYTLRTAAIPSGAPAMGYLGSWYLEGERRVSTLEAIGRNVAMMANPVAIPQVDYSFLKHPGTRAGAWPFSGALVVAGWAAALASLLWPLRITRANARAARRRRLAAAGLAWAALFLVPYLHLVPIGALMAGRFVYLPLMGLAMAGAAMAGGVRLGSTLGIALVAVWLGWSALFAGLLVARIEQWQSGVALFTAEVERQPTHAFAWSNLATAQSAVGDKEAALFSIREAVRLTDDSGVWSLKHAMIARQNRRREEALQALDLARLYCGADHPDVLAEEQLWRIIDAGQSGGQPAEPETTSGE